MMLSAVRRLGRASVASPMVQAAARVPRASQQQRVISSTAAVAGESGDGKFIFEYDSGALPGSTLLAKFKSGDNQFTGALAECDHGSHYPNKNGDMYSSLKGSGMIHVSTDLQTWEELSSTYQDGDLKDHLTDHVMHDIQWLRHSGSNYLAFAHAGERSGDPGRVIFAHQDGDKWKYVNDLTDDDSHFNDWSKGENVDAVKRYFDHGGEFRPSGLAAHRNSRTDPSGNGDVWILNGFGKPVTYDVDGESVTDSGWYVMKAKRHNGEWEWSDHAWGPDPSDSNDPHLNNPKGIMYNPKDGRIYIADAANQQISVWHSSGANEGELDYTIDLSAHGATPSDVTMWEHNTSWAHHEDVDLDRVLVIPVYDLDPTLNSNYATGVFIYDQDTSSVVSKIYTKEAQPATASANTHVVHPHIHNDKLYIVAGGSNGGDIVPLNWTEHAK